MKCSRLVACLFSLALCRESIAAITDISFQLVDNSAVASLSGYVTQDVVVTGTGQLTSVELLLDVGAGNIYQDGVGNSFAPNALFFPTFPSLEFDTFVGLGGRTQGVGFTPSIAGGAVDIGGAAAATFTDAKIDMTWFPAGGDVISDPTDYFVARLTLKEGAKGLLSVAAFTGTEGYTLLDVPIFGVCSSPSLEGMVLNSGDLSADLQGAFDNRGGGPIVLANAILLQGGCGDLDDLGAITASLAFGDDTGNAFASGSVTDDDGDGQYDIMIDADWSNLVPGQVLAGEVQFQAELGEPNVIGFDFSISVPEPSTFAIAGLALVGLVGMTRRHSG